LNKSQQDQDMSAKILANVIQLHLQFISFWYPLFL